MLIFDATHTSHTAAQTGIQRVCRALFGELAAQGAIAPVCFDPHMDGWRPLAPAEVAVLCDRSGGKGRSRGAKWTLSQKVSGAARRLLNARPELPAATALICPELFSAKVGAQLPKLLPKVAGPRVAIFYDAIPLKFPELTPPGTVSRFPAYLQELLQFDGIAAISEDSAASLRDYWRWLGVGHAPPVQAVPLGIDPTAEHPPATVIDNATVPRVLSVGTIEGRKNHLALLHASESLWREGLVFELQLIGLARPDTAGPALTQIQILRQAGWPVLFGGSVPESELHAAYRQCSFTVYPSLIEGFGLPVLESLQYGKPCVCSARGALGEAARDGGCLALDSVDAVSLATAIRRLLKNPTELNALAAAARDRKYRSWRDYAKKMTDWMATLRQH